MESVYVTEIQRLPHAPRAYTKNEGDYQSKPLGLAAHRLMFSQIGPAPSVDYQIQNPRIRVIGSCPPYLFAKKNKRPAPGYAKEIFDHYGLRADGYTQAEGTKKTTLNVLKRFDRPEPVCPPDDPALLRAYEALKLRMQPMFNTCGLMDTSERVVRNTSSGLIGQFLTGTHMKKPAFIAEHWDHCLQLRRDILVSTEFPPILSQGHYKKEILKEKKVEEGRERLFIGKNADESDLEQEVFGHMNKLFKHSVFPEFLAGWSPQKKGFHTLLQSYRNCVHIIKGDCTTFDTTAWGILLKLVYQIRWELWSKKCKEKYKRYFDYFLWTLEHHWVTLPTGIVVYIWWCIDSGKFNTSCDGSLIHWLCFARALFKHHPAMPLDWWNYHTLGFMSDDHLFGLHSYRWYITAEQRFEAYREVGLQLSPEEDEEFEIKDFERDILQTYILGAVPITITYNNRSYFMPVPKYKNKLVASILKGTTKTDVQFFQRCCGVAAAAFWDKDLYRACVDVIDEGIRRGVVTRKQLRHRDELHQIIDYPEYATLFALWLGLD